MSKHEFLTMLSSLGPEESARRFLWATEVEAFPTEAIYSEFKDSVTSEIDAVEHVCLVGTGNWRYSLNPDKNFKLFDESSDIDVAVISELQFNATWTELRRVEREQYMYLSTSARQQLIRNSQNVYSGFVSPMWIPDKKSSFRYSHYSLLNRLSSEVVGYKPVKMMFFKNEIETIEYYKRGIRKAIKGSK